MEPELRLTTQSSLQLLLSTFFSIHVLNPTSGSGTTASILFSFFKRITCSRKFINLKQARTQNHITLVCPTQITFLQTIPRRLNAILSLSEILIRLGEAQI